MIQATDEAIIDSIAANQPMTGRDGVTVRVLPHAKVAALLAARGVINSDP